MNVYNNLVLVLYNKVFLIQNSLISSSRRLHDVFLYTVSALCVSHSRYPAAAWSGAAHSQVKEKSYHSSFYFWDICGCDFTLLAVLTNKKLFYLCLGESEGLFTADVRPSNRARTLIGKTRFYFSPVALI